MAINYVDRFLEREVVDIGCFQMVGVTALFIAAKFQVRIMINFWREKLAGQFGGKSI
jgi:hypothetical protein